jgi:hypothetical protein
MRKITAEDTRRIPWHPAFVQALALELDQYQDSLQILPEYQLTSEPLLIDCVVIKKTKNITIDKNIGAIFRGYNLVEYKSPEDYLSVEDYYKVYGYACLYASMEKRSVTDMTISFVGSRYPRKLMKHLEEERGYGVEKRGPGIYSIRGDVMAVQVIDSRELPEEENLWLRDLDDHLEAGTMERVQGEVLRRGKAARLDAYLYAIMRANAGVLEEAMRMSKSAKTLDRVLEEAGLTAKWEERGRDKGRHEGWNEGRTEGLTEGLSRGRSEGRREGWNEGRTEGLTEGLSRGRNEARRETARKLRDMGLPVEQIAQATGLSPEAVRGKVE